MRFLADQDVYQATIDFLRSNGHSVLRAYDLGLSRAEDAMMLARAVAEKCVLITRDKDFGALTFVFRSESLGVVLLRVLPETVDAVHVELLRFIEEHRDEDLSQVFVVVEPGRHRIRRSG